MLIQKILDDFATAHFPRETLGRTLLIANIQNNVTQYKSVGANTGTLLLELGAHLNHARERVVLIDPLIVGKDGVAAQTLIVILIEFQDGIVLRSTVLNAALHHGIVKVNISIVATEVASNSFSKRLQILFITQSWLPTGIRLS